MSIEGVWNLEIMGLHGWERLATVFLENGRYLSASSDHYAIGGYEVDGKQFKATASATQYGAIRTVFGSKKKELKTVLIGKQKKDGSIVGKISQTDGKGADINMRLNRLGDLD